MILTAFFGYVLPWGQMSFRAATVITNVASTIPIIGEKLVIWLWGGFSVGNATLNKFFSLHYLMPFVILGLVFVHLVFLHEFGSNNPLGLNFKVDQIPINPYFTLKDFYSIFLFIFLFSIFIFFVPNLLGHPDNYIQANPEITPEHIVPEWYLLPFYAILRSVPNKLGGVIALALAIVIILILPFISKACIRSSQFRPLYQKMFWFFLIDCFILGWIGAKPIEAPYLIIGQLSTIFYFTYFILILPVLNKLDKYLLFFK
jgi:ubiquinol-cytochrome c reductase cytochrome b subunit